MKKTLYSLLFLGAFSTLVSCGSATGSATGPEETTSEIPTTTTTTLPQVACPTNSSTSTASSLSACTSSAGYYDCNSGTCKDVGPGYFSLGGDNTRTQCPAGSYSTGNNNSVCVACGSGTFQSSAGQTSCGACTNLPTNASSVVYSNTDSAFTANVCNYQTVTCNTGYHDPGNKSCVQDSYTATYATTHSLSACDGTQNFTENLTSCVSQQDGSTDLAQCAATSSVQYQSPAGTKDVTISNGTRHDTCALGSSTPSSQTVTCNSGHYDNGSASCSACTNTTTGASSVVYDNSQTGLTTNSCTITDVTCSQYYTKSGVTCTANTVAAPSGAASTPTASITTNSSTVTATVDSNTTDLTLYSDASCTAQIGSGAAAQAASGITITGLTDQTTTVYGKATNSVTGQASSCTSLTTFKYWPSDTFTATYTNNNTLVACDGTQNLTQNLTSCIGDNTGISDNSKCASTASVSMQSPAGTKDVTISNGTRHDTCALGSSTPSSQTVDCNTPYSGTATYTCAYRITILATGGDNNLIATNAAVKISGYAGSGALGNGTTSPNISSLTSISVGLGTIVDMCSSNSRSCATDGTTLKCWGNNGAGQLGVGDTTDRSSPVAVSHGLGTITKLACGGFHTCATDGTTLKCWGANYNGRLGNGNTTNQTSPVVVNVGFTGITQIGAGEGHTCATDGTTLKCWGSGSSGRLGTGDQSDRINPTVISTSLSFITKLAVGPTYTCATDGTTLKCWGVNYYGQLGTGDTTDRLNPTTISHGLSSIANISTGFPFMCVTDGSTNVKCSGNNSNGELGTGASPAYSYGLIPVSHAFTSVTMLKSGSHHTCAIDVTTLKCWGDNRYGQIGSGYMGGAYLDPTVVAFGP